MEIRRTFNRHGIHLLLEKPPVAREACVTMGRVYVQLLSESIDSILEVLRRGYNFISSMLSKEIPNPLPTAAAADHSQLYS
jgi:hypothetical protein